LAAKENARHFRTARRRESSLKTNSKQVAASKRRSGKAEEEILELVRAGVERFILKKATVEDFLRTMRAASEKEEIYSHQLTRSVFSRIVKEAIRKRNLKRSQ
jgi:DNA-binding NarL/FixJ family response regulator